MINEVEYAKWQYKAAHRAIRLANRFTVGSQYWWDEFLERTKDIEKKYVSAASVSVEEKHNRYPAGAAWWMWKQNQIEFSKGYNVAARKISAHMANWFIPF